MAPVVLIYKQTNPLDFLGGILFAQTLLSLFAIPGILTVINYYKRNSQLKLILAKDENAFFLIKNDKKEIHYKSDVEKRVQIDSNANLAPWTNLEYSVLLKKDGTKIFLSNLIIDSSDIDKHFQNIRTESKKKWIPMMP